MKPSNAAKIGRGVCVLAGLALGGLSGKAGTSLAAEHTWAQKVDMPTARWMHSASVVDGKIYVTGGAGSEPDLEAISAMEVYDPVMDNWTTEADIPTPRAAFSTSVVDGKIYAIGGSPGAYVPCSVVEEYDPAIGTWSSKAAMPTPRMGLSASTVDGKIYAIGGTVGLPLAGINTVEAYDPVTDTWTRKANMPLGVWGLCTTVVNGKIYALGGRPGVLARPYVQEYNPATDTWTRKSDMPVGTSNMGSVVLGDKIIVIGGWLRSENDPYTIVQIYDPAKDIWTIEGDAPFLRASFSASVLNNRIYAIGGTDRPHPCPATSTVYELSAPPPDFSGDGTVDIKDLLILIESWGQDDPLADIAPAFGDGVVNVLDLELLMSCWGQTVEDPTLLAHWTLDETEGMVAHDSAITSDGTVVGIPAWRPADGAVDGALELNGTTFVVTDPVLNTSAGPFSVLAWVQGGAPGQTIISQQGGANWLIADAGGQLMTELKSAGRQARLLYSESVITGGDWHRVGFTWDGSYRRLYFDDVLVAEDTDIGLEECSGGLYIGCAASMAPGTFWEGLIDDVRIYNRALRP
jgi:N-acetylneuraminic acid mutarotase